VQALLKLLTRCVCGEALGILNETLTKHLKLLTVIHAQVRAASLYAATPSKSFRSGFRFLSSRFSSEARSCGMYNTHRERVRAQWTNTHTQSAPAPHITSLHTWYIYTCASMCVCTDLSLSPSLPPSPSLSPHSPRITCPMLALLRLAWPWRARATC